MLSIEYNYDRWKLQELIKSVKIIPSEIKPCPIVLVADCTFFSRNDGICIFYAANLKKVISYTPIITESKLIYNKMKEKIEYQGFTIETVVLDGRVGIKNVFKKIPIQMCQFHQLAIIRRYITNNPRLEASKELKKIVNTLCRSSKKNFVDKFEQWCSNWENFLKEKTYKENGKWHYKHRRLRSAKRSIKANITYLFIYLKYPDLNIPNTTNSVESINAKIKELLRVHRGFGRNLKDKIIAEILCR